MTTIKYLFSVAVSFKNKETAFPHVSSGTYAPERWTNPVKNRETVRTLNAKDSTRILEHYVNENDSTETWALRLAPKGLYNHDVIYLEDDTGIAQYAVELETVVYDNVPASTQISIIKNDKFIGIDHLAQYVFWQYILPIHGRIVTDGVQFLPAVKFWRWRTTEAWQKGYFVYLIDLEKPEGQQYNLIKSNEFKNYVDWLWGNDEYVHGSRLLMISKDILC